MQYNKQNKQQKQYMSNIKKTKTNKIKRKQWTFLCLSKYNQHKKTKKLQSKNY